MARIGRLATPPIKEVLVDLRIASATAIETAVFQPLKERYSPRYPKSEVRHQFETQFEARAGKAPEMQTRDRGFTVCF